MADKSKIEWLQNNDDGSPGSTWNPIRGCSRVSEGCRNCYAETVANRFKGPGLPYEGLIASGGQWNGQIKLVPEALEQPIRWRKKRRIFVNSMSDLFHEGVSEEYIDTVFATMALAPQHSFLVLTKRPERMRAYMADTARAESVGWEESRVYEDWGRGLSSYYGPAHRHELWPLPNVWLGVSIEDQPTADERIPLLMDTPAKIRWVSAEPLLGHIDISKWPLQGRPGWPGLNWVVVGGESGPGARAMHPDWARSLRDQCSAAGVPLFFKQFGEWAEDTGAGGLEALDRAIAASIRGTHTFADGLEVYRYGKKAAGRQLDGRTHDDYPAEIWERRAEG